MPNLTQVREKTLFERHPKKTIFAIIIILLLLIEAASLLILHFKDVRTKAASYNRTLSGYYVFKNTPNYRHHTIKDAPHQADVVTDEYGFVTDSPIAAFKPANTIRIFLMGGSTMFGAGQATRAVDAWELGVPKYPRGKYTYELSIAGQLKQYLEGKKPDVNFEVINAAAYTRALHHSMALYAETVSRLSPDYIVNMDGINDLVPLAGGGMFYKAGEKFLNSFLELELKARSGSVLAFSNTYRVLNRAFDRFIPRHSQKFSKETYWEGDKSEYSLNAYRKNRNKYVANADRYFQIARHYMAFLRSDDVEFLFVMQPMLNRVLKNKKLSPDEISIAQRMFPPVWSKEMGKVQDYTLVLKYFYDDYLSPEMKNVVENGGFGYIDMNEEFKKLDQDVTAYTDYCHLTPAGNQFVAERIGSFILKQLTTHRKHYIDRQPAA